MAAVSLVLTEIVVQYYGIVPLLVIVLGNLTGGGILLLASARHRAHIQPIRPGRDWAAVVVAALCIYSLSYLLRFNAIGRIGSGKTALLGQLETPFVMTLAILCLGEPVSARRWLAGLLALSGALLINFDLRAWQLTLGWGEVQAMLASLGTATGIIIISFAFFTVILQAVVAKFGPTLGLQLPANLLPVLVGGVLVALGIVILHPDLAQVDQEI